MLVFDWWKVVDMVVVMELGISILVGVLKCIYLLFSDGCNLCIWVMLYVMLVILEFGCFRCFSLFGFF